MTRWLAPLPVDLPPVLLTWLQDPLLTELLVRRGFTNVASARAFLNPDDYEPSPPTELPDLSRAVDRLSQAIDAGERICVWGDFDVDGQTATTVLLSTLQELGAEVRFYIPDRLTESHGIARPALERQFERGLDLLLTCDTGVTAFEAVATARAAGVDVVVTDHHDLAGDLPAAVAVVNPKRLPARHPLGELPGVGVAYKLSEALYIAYGQAAAAAKHLDLVALGIVADVAVQTGDTRYLLQRGLEALRASSRAGLQALLEVANLQAANLNEEHVGFWLGPRLNALGRLGDANQAVELLTTADEARGRILAVQLDALNERRKMLVDRVTIQALSQVEDDPALAEGNAVVLAGRDWHPGVVGLAASRLADRFNKPAVLIAAGPGDTGRGSARSVPGCDIHQALKTQAELLESFGGHPMAAGLALSMDNLARFRWGLSQALADCPAGAERTLTVDAKVDLAEVTPEFVARIERLAPFGPGNPPVRLVASGLTVVEERLMGRGRAHRRLRVADRAGDEAEVIWWNGAAMALPSSPFELAVTLRRPDALKPGPVQLEWLAAREWQPAPVRRALEIVDLRQVPEPRKAFEAVLSEAQVWLEGEPEPPLNGLARHELSETDTLILWSIPPCAEVLHQILVVTRPRRLYLVARPCSLDRLATFVPRLLGLVKYGLTHHGGQLDLELLAGAMAHRLATIDLALRWLVCRGGLRLISTDDMTWRVEAADSAQAAAPELCAALAAGLETVLAETAAYRIFMRQAAPALWSPEKVSSQ